MISIITVTFNNYTELLKTLESVEGLGVENIVVNGGSCLKTKIFLNNNNSVISISESDNGIADAFTRGVKLASKKYICFVNSGDLLIDREYFVNIKGYLSQDYDIICCDNIHQIEGVGEVYKICKMKLPNMPYNHQGLIVKKKLIEETEFFDECFKISMDYDSIVKIFKKFKTLKIHYYKKLVILMDGSGVSHSRNYVGELEKLKSLHRNKMLTPRFGLQFLTQYAKAQIKRFLICIGLVSIVNLYKKLTNKRVY